jgi:predicted CoA-binding protein
MTKIDALTREFLSQKNIAVAGVKRNSQGTANVIYKKLKESGYNVFPINPNSDTFDGVKCYPAIKSVTEKIDGVVIVTKPSVTEQIVNECIETGVKRVWIHNMFGVKGSSSAGTSLSEKAIRMCKENNITVIPGGCPLMFCEPVDFGHKCIRGITRMIGGFKF